jgi:hypothetical protein
MFLGIALLPVAIAQTDGLSKELLEIPSPWHVLDSCSSDGRLVFRNALRPITSIPVDPFGR